MQGHPSISSMSAGSSCPAGSAGSSRSKSSSSAHSPLQKEQSSYYPDSPSFLAQLIQTLVVVGLWLALGYFGWFVYHDYAKEPIRVVLGRASVFVFHTLPDFLRNFKELLWNIGVVDWKMVFDPANWFDGEQVNWDKLFSVNIWVSSYVLVTFAMDMFISSESEQGHPILVLPVLGQAIVYGVISIQAQASGLLSFEVFFSGDVAQIGEKIFSVPQVVVMNSIQTYALSLTLVYVMMKDFYSRISSRRMEYRLLMLLLAVLIMAGGIVVSPVYLILRSTLFASSQINQSQGRPVNSFQTEREYLYDPIPQGAGAVNTWVQLIPSPLNLPFYVFFCLLGAVRFVAFSLIYLLYVVLLCFPVSAIFFSLRRSWNLMMGKPIQGALYTPFERLSSDMPFPPKAVLVVTGHLRLMSFKCRSSILFNLMIGCWLNKFLEASYLFEFFITLAKGPSDIISTYCAFLMSEFGPVFPMGRGLGFGKHEMVKHFLENPIQRKGPLGFAWKHSSSHANWSKNILIALPKKQIDASVVDQGREIIRSWLKNVSTDLEKDIVKERMNTILPLANPDGTMVDEVLIRTAFGSTLFALLTDGAMTAEERKHYFDLTDAKGSAIFFSDLMNNILFGGHLVLKSITLMDEMRSAFLRFADAPALQRALSTAEKNKWGEWTSPEVVRFLLHKFCVAGGGAPSLLLSSIVQLLYDQPHLIAKYQENKLKFILECARLDRGVPISKQVAYDFNLPGGEQYATIFGKNIGVPDGTELFLSITNANHDTDAFGQDAGELNFDRDVTEIQKLLTFNGNVNDIQASSEKGNYDCPPRRCPGFHYSVSIIEFLVDRYMPKDNAPTINPSRFNEIQNNATYFQSCILKAGQVTYSMNNKRFPSASDVTHPLDTNGKALGSAMVVAGGKRAIPVYDEDLSWVEAVKDRVIGRVLSVTPVTDDEGEWRSESEAVAWRAKVFGSNFPPVNSDYCTSARTCCNMMTELAFAGIFLLHTQKVTSLSESSLAHKHCPDGALYVNDNSALGEFNVRRGYDRYGSVAYFSADYKLIGIFTCFDNKYIAIPDSIRQKIHEHDEEDHTLEKEEYSEWQHAQWVWRVSGLALGTVVDHLVNVHMVAANSLVTASRLHLSIHHPFRAFIKMFTFRTVGINYKAGKTLLPRNGVVSRVWAFTNDDLEELLMNSAPNTFQKNFRNYIPESMRDVDDFPANQDLVEFCDIVTTLVKEFLKAIYDSDGADKQRLQRNIDNDPAFQGFLGGLADGLGLVQCIDLSMFDDVVDVITSLICNVTGMHELVGQISDYFAHPKLGGTTIRRGKQIDSIQITQLTATLVSSTGLRMPRLMDNWEPLLDRNEYADKTIKIMRRFQEQLKELSAKINERNQTRKIPMQAFDPTNMESSVSV